MSKDLQRLRERMVERQVAARGITDERLLDAMKTVPREAFVATPLREFAYEDSPLPIEAGQTISQPYIVAAMIEALDLEEDDRVLEVGVGSGYAAAVMSRLCREVYGVERHAELAEQAERRCRELGYDNVHIRHGDGTLGWEEHAPFDAMSVAAAGPRVPQPLLDQLAIGGCLVIPVGSQREQELVRVVREGEEDWRREELGGVRFVPLIGEAGWEEPGQERSGAGSGSAGGSPAREPASPGTEGEGGAQAAIAQERRRERPEAPAAGAEYRAQQGGSRSGDRDRQRRGSRSGGDGDGVVSLVHESCHPFGGIDEADLSPLLERIGDARVVLLGEATHGTSEFYRFRARVTRELVEKKGFNVVAAEADWPDAARIDHFIQHRPEPPAERAAFSRFPTWMWRNREFEQLVTWMRRHNEGIDDPARRVSFHGLDLYSLHSSIEEVLRYLDDVDPEAAQVARTRYGCLSPWEQDPALYGRATLSGRYETCEDQVVETLTDLLKKRVEYAERDGERFLDAERNARVVANAERYYRVMYYGSRDSWNLRDQHMYDTLEGVLDFRGEDSRAVVWAHNSHNGDAAATEMGARGETNLGHLSRQGFGDKAFLVGFGTDHGTVAAASDWGGKMEIKDVRPSHQESYENLCHRTGEPSFILPLRDPENPELVEALSGPRLERAIGVIYRPQTELASHYFQAVLPRQFDAWIWLDATRAVTPLPPPREREGGVPDTWPFGV